MTEGQRDAAVEGANRVRAACVTPPGAGGIAVIQVLGPGAAALVEPFLRARQPVALQQMDESELRLVRVVDGHETIDDAIVTVRRTDDGRTVVDINLHGGPRIVQRILLLLRRAGARIVEPLDLLPANWPTATPLERDLLPALLRAKTRPVAAWLAAMPARFTTEIQRVLTALAVDDFDAARSKLLVLCENERKLGYLVNGVRVVLTGGPNVGKSTLANALAAREDALVSEVPGTTRDWVEHAGAVDGVPFTFVDTAGLRTTADEIEAEAVRRGREQVASADVVLRVIDVSSPTAEEDRQDIQAALAASVEERGIPSSHGAQSGRRRCLFAWNKSDLASNPGQIELLISAHERGVLVSAKTEAGLAELRGRLLQAMGLRDWRTLVAPVTGEQSAACRRALSELIGPVPAQEGAAAALEQMLAGAGARNSDNP